MEYLGRAIFEFPVNWSNPANREFSYDLKEVQLGFGAEIYTSLQQHVVHGFEVTVDLLSDDEIGAMEEFFEELSGRLTGFWLPSSQGAVQIVAAVSSTQFKIKTQGLAATWENHPAVHLRFERAGHTSSQAKITAVEDLGNGTERVTVEDDPDAEESLSADLFDPETSVSRLHYVRLAGDEERGRYISEGQMRRALRMVELPTEYEEAETGTQPIYLYHLWLPAPIDHHWRFTSFAADVVSGNQLFARGAITHKGIQQSFKPEGQTVTLETGYAADHPLALFLPLPPSAPMNVEVLRASYVAPDAATILFSGRVKNVQDDGDRLTATCESWLALLRQKVPAALIQPGCNHHVYDRKTCRVEPAFFQKLGTIASISARSCNVAFAVEPATKVKAFDYFAQGWIETGDGAHREVRSVIRSKHVGDEVVLHLNAPLIHAEAGQTVLMLPGCNGTMETCVAKFNNRVNFGGFPFVPNRNPALEPINQTAAEGGKK